jgi:hypothetical protein
LTLYITVPHFHVKIFQCFYTNYDFSHAQAIKLFFPLKRCIWPLDISYRLLVSIIVNKRKSYRSFLVHVVVFKCINLCLCYNINMLSAFSSTSFFLKLCIDCDLDSLSNKLIYHRKNISVRPIYILFWNLLHFKCSVYSAYKTVNDCL